MSEKPPPPRLNPALKKRVIQAQVEYLDNVYTVMESLPSDEQAGVLARAGYSEAEYHAMLTGEDRTGPGLNHISNVLAEHLKVPNVASPLHAIFRMLRRRVDSAAGNGSGKKPKKNVEIVPTMQNPSEATTDAPAREFRPAHKVYLANIGFAMGSMTRAEQDAVLARAGHSRDEYLGMVEGRADPVGLDDITEALATHFGVSWNGERETPRRVASKIRKMVTELTAPPAENIAAPAENPAVATVDTASAAAGEAVVEVSGAAATLPPAPDDSADAVTPPPVAEAPATTAHQGETAVSDVDARAVELHTLKDLHRDEEKRKKLGAAVRVIRGQTTPKVFLSHLCKCAGEPISKDLDVRSYLSFEAGNPIAVLPFYDILRAFSPDIDMAVAEIYRQAAAVGAATEKPPGEAPARMGVLQRIRADKRTMARIEEVVPIWWHLSYSLPDKLAPLEDKPVRMEVERYLKLRDEAIKNVLAARMKCPDEVFVKLYDINGEPTGNLKRLPVASLFRQKGKIIYYHPEAINCGAITGSMVEVEMIRLIARQIADARAKAAAQNEALRAPIVQTGDLSAGQPIAANAPEAEHQTAPPPEAGTLAHENGVLVHEMVPLNSPSLALP